MSAVIVERRGPALWATLDRPERANACGSEVMAGLEHWLERAHEREVRALVLTGNGTSFCAGADLKEAGSLVDDHQRLLAFLARGRDLVASLRSAPVPVIAAVNGVAFAGGLELMLGCDLVVASESARIGDRHLVQGQVPGWGSSAMLPTRTGRSTVARLLLTGETLTAAEACAHGLVGEVVPDHRLAARAEELVDLLAARDTEAVRRTLSLTRRRTPDEVAAARLEWEVLLEHVSDADTRRRAAQFASPTAPRPSLT